MTEELAAIAGPAAALLAALMVFAHDKKEKAGEAKPKPEPHAASSLIVSRYQQLSTAFRSGNKADILRHQHRIAQAGYVPPESAEDCERCLIEGRFERAE